MVKDNIIVDDCFQILWYIAISAKLKQEEEQFELEKHKGSYITDISSLVENMKMLARI